MPSIPVLFVGDAEWGEFREVHRWLGDRAVVCTAVDIAAALPALELGKALPELIVIARRWPGESSECQVDQLRRLAPLARIVELSGSWCEGLPRSEDVLPATLPLDWHRAIARLEPEFERAARGEPTAWSLPTTATEDERLLASLPAQTALRAPRGLLAVRAANSETAAALCSVAAGYGFGAVWVRSRIDDRVAGVTGAIWDSQRDLKADALELAEWRTSLGNAPIAVLVDFPRVEDCRLLAAHGASFVVSKPFWLGDLFGRLTTACRLRAS